MASSTAFSCFNSSSLLDVVLFLALAAAAATEAPPAGVGTAGAGGGTPVGGGTGGGTVGLLTAGGGWVVLTEGGRGLVLGALVGEGGRGMEAAVATGREAGVAAVPDRGCRSKGDLARSRPADGLAAFSAMSKMWTCHLTVISINVDTLHQSHVSQCQYSRQHSDQQTKGVNYHLKEVT